MNINSGTIGAHVRHVVEHYQSLLLGSDNADNIDYDNRSRNSAIETQTATAITTLNKLIIALQQITADKIVDVLCSTNTDAKTNPTTSSLRRELVFVHSHTTHHMAIIRILALLMNVPINENFGKAASTQKFEHNVQS